MTSLHRCCLLLVATLLAIGDAHAGESVAAFSGNTSYVAPDGRVLLREGEWSASAIDRNGDGGVDYVEVSNTPPGGFPKRFVFATSEPGRNIDVGTYRVARPLERPDKNYFSFGADSTCSMYDMQAGFVVLDAEFDTSGPSVRVLSFVARFALACSLQPSPVYGYVGYNAVELPEIATADYSAAQRTVTLRGPNITSADSIRIGDLAFPAKRGSDDSLTARKVRLPNGDYTVRVGVSSSGYQSPGYPLRVGGQVAKPFSRSRLKISSEPGNFVGGLGGIYRLVNGQFYVGTSDYTDDGDLDAADVRFEPTEGQSRWNVQLSPAVAGRNFEEGSYPDAMGFPVVEGHPGLTVMGESRTCQDQVGFFTITDYAVDRADGIDQLLWLVVRFDMRCNFVSPPLHGTLAYLAPAVPVITRVVFEEGSRELRVEGRNLSPRLKLHVDGQKLGPLTTSQDALVLGNFDLLPGMHAIYLATEYPDPVVSSRPVIVRR